MEFARRTSHLREEGAYAVLARAQALEAEGRDIIHLEIGQPDFDTYPHIALAGIRAIATGKTRYNPPKGVPQLREALATDAGQRRGVTLARDQVIIAPGTKPLLILPMMALLEAGDEVIYPDPGFPSYAAAIGIVGARGVPVPLLEDLDFDLDLDAFDAALSPRTRLVILNSPGNPTGTLLSPQTLAHIADAAHRRDLWVLSDEIYMRLVYEGDAPSIIGLPGMQERTVIADGFSKSYAMTGWRLGFGIMPQSLADKVGLLLTHITGCTATFTQHAGLAAVLAPQRDVEDVREAFRRRRDVMVQGLNRIPGMRCGTPPGAFYCFPNVRAYGLSSADLAEYLLDRASVAVLPGTAFGVNGEGHLRLSYASSVAQIEEGLSRMAEALSAL